MRALLSDFDVPNNISGQRSTSRHARFRYYISLRPFPRVIVMYTYNGRVLNVWMTEQQIF